MEELAIRDEDAQLNSNVLIIRGQEQFQYFSMLHRQCFFFLIQRLHKATEITIFLQNLYKNLRSHVHKDSRAVNREQWRKSCPRPCREPGHGCMPSGGTGPAAGGRLAQQLSTPGSTNWVGQAHLPGFRGSEGHRIRQ